MSESVNAYQATHPYPRSYPWEASVPDRFAHPRNPFIPFDRRDIEQSIPRRFEQQVRLYPGRLAVQDNVCAFTYGELNRAANRVAWAILSASGKKVPTVVLLVEHGAPAIAALMGVLKAGKAYVPVDASYPRTRLEYMLEDSLADLIVTDRANLNLAHDLAQSMPVHVLCLDELDANLSVENPGLDISPDDYAYILYTSGSTGWPKGVLGSHRQVLHFSMAFTNAIHITQEDRMSLAASLAFSASLAYIFHTLLNGAALFPIDMKDMQIGQIADWLVNNEITIYATVPMVFRQLCDTLSPDRAFPKLRMIRLGGDRVERGDVDLYKEHFGRDCVFFVGYGATECKIITQLFVNHDSVLDEGVLPVGYPAHDMELLLVDEDGQPVAPGQVGEIVIKSRYLAPGYWRSPELTAERFLPDPEGSDARLYLTGDLGRMAEDGCLTHLGRKDSQVKIRGFRVEIAEVEAALLDLDGVRQAVVVARQRQRDGGEGGPLRLVAYVVPEKLSVALAEGLTTSILRRRLGERLPDYMIPSAFVMLDEMPLNANGKIDRRALPEPDMTRPELEIAYVAPRDNIESELVEIWEEILGIQPVGVKDSFYELGGNSLLVARLFARVESRQNESAPGTVSLDTFFRSPTVEQLAQIHSRAQAGDSLPRQPERSGARGTGRSTRRRKPQRDPPLVEIKNRLLQILALYAPGARTLRVRMHRMRGVRIGQNVFIGLGVILESGHPRMVSIGNCVTISVRSVVIAHFAGSARWARLSDEASVRIEDNVYIGPGVIILPNVTIGQGAVVAAGSIVSQSVPPLTMVQGNPARPVAECGIPLAGNTYEQFMRSLRPTEVGGKLQKGARRIE